MRVDPIEKEDKNNNDKWLTHFTPRKLYINLHGGESCDILNIYSDRTCKKIDHYFFNTQGIFMR